MAQFSNIRKAKRSKKTKKSTSKDAICTGYPNRPLYKNHSQEATFSLNSNDYLADTEKNLSCNDPHPPIFLSSNAGEDIDEGDMIVISYEELYDAVNPDVPICLSSYESASAAYQRQDSECYIHIDLLSQKATATGEVMCECLSSQNDEDVQDNFCILITYDEIQNSGIYKNETSISENPFVITINYDELQDSFTFKSKQDASKDFSIVAISHDELQNITVFKNEKESPSGVFTNANKFTPRVILEEDVEFDDLIVKVMPGSASMSISSQTIGDCYNEVPLSSICTHETNNIDIEDEVFEKKNNVLQSHGINVWNYRKSDTNESNGSISDLSDIDNELLLMPTPLQNKLDKEYFESWPYIEEREKQDNRAYTKCSDSFCKVKTENEANNLNGNPTGKDKDKTWTELTKFSEPNQEKIDTEIKERTIDINNKPLKSSSNHVTHPKHDWKQQDFCSDIRCNCLESNLKGIKDSSSNEMYDHYCDGRGQNYWLVSSDHNQTPWGDCLDVFDMNDSRDLGTSGCLKSEGASNSNVDPHIQEKLNQNMNESHTELITQQKLTYELSDIKYLSNFGSWYRTSSPRGTCIPCNVYNEHPSTHQQQNDSLHTENMADNLIEYNKSLFLPDYHMQIVQATGETLYIEIIPILIYTENGIPVFLTPTYFE
ncbi:hypothetical protein G6F43_012082 [Rhizopus delemar]|nr:hypothetical protein G6F43_012082 [Rhizopus delemar]